MMPLFYKKSNGFTVKKYLPYFERKYKMEL